MTTVSVVIATRDRPELLRRAVRSITTQEFDGELEIVVVFDGTEPDALADLDDSRIRTLSNARTPGLAGARNTGMRAARGSIIAFCDDDDEWLPGKLALQLDVLAREPRTSIVASGIRIVAADGTEHDRIAPEQLTRADLFASRHTEAHPSTFLFRRALIDEVGEVDESLPGSYAEDYDLLLRAAEYAPVRCVPTPLAIVHWDRTSFFAERWQQIASALTYLLLKFPEFQGSRRGLSRVEGQIAFAHAALHHRREALTWARGALRHDWRRPQAWAALAVGTGLVSGGAVLQYANGRGKGV